MRKINVDELKEIQIGILDYVDNYCKNHDIKYWLDFGSLIGAVRHHGYIPWDDDIDIGMMRKDFDLFLENFGKNNDRYKLICFENDRSTPWTFGKIIDTRTKLIEKDMRDGFSFFINIDVFIYDNAPDDDLAYLKLFKKLRAYQILNAHQANAYKLHGNIFRKLVICCIKLVLPLFPEGYFAEKFNILRKKYNSLNTNRVVCYSLIRKPINRKCLSETKLCIFENSLYPIPVDYDTHLNNVFSIPYMELPPESQRINTHFFEAYIDD